MPSVLMSLYGIDDLRLIDGSKLSLSATMHNVKEYGSYKTVNNVDSLTTDLDNANTVHLSSGIMFNTEYDSTGNYEKYGPIKGYTVLSRDLTGDYGAFAYGETNSPGRLWTVNGDEISHIPRSGETGQHDPFWLWILIGTERRDVAIVAEGNGSNNQGNTNAYVSLITLGDLVNERLVLNSGTLEMVYGATMDGGSSNVARDHYRLTVGSSGNGCISFNGGNGIIVNQDFAISSGEISSHTGSEISAEPKIKLDLRYRNNQTLTGLIGKITLEFVEEKNSDHGWIPVCSIIVEISIYCTQNGSSFAGTEQTLSSHTYTVMMYIDSGNGDATFSIPAGFTGRDLEFSSYTVNGRSSLDRCIAMSTAENSDGHSGWQGATGIDGGKLNECLHRTYRLSGGFIATLEFTAEGILESDIANNSSVTLKFCIEGNPNAYFAIQIIFDKIMLPTIKGILQSHGSDVYMAFAQNAAGHYSISIPGLEDGTVELAMSGFHEAQFEAIWGEDGKLDVTLETQSRGVVPAFITIYRQDDTDVTAEWFRTVFFIAGPLEDASS